MRRICEFLGLTGLLSCLIFFLLVYIDEQENKPKKASFGEAYANTTTHNNLPEFFQLPVQPVQPDLGKIPVHSYERKKPPIIPGRSKKNNDISLRKSLFIETFGGFLLERCLAEGLDSSQFNVLVALVGHESGWEPYRKNPTSSARGFFQLLNCTGKDLCRDFGIPPDLYDPYNPYQNLMLGVHLYAKNFKKFKSVKWAVSAHYNGPGAVKEVAEYFGGVEKDPFVKQVAGMTSIPCKKLSKKEAKQWKKYLSYGFY